jgi:hypothetical protein
MPLQMRRTTAEAGTTASRLGTNQAVETAGALPQGHRGTRGDPFMTAG